MPQPQPDGAESAISAPTRTAIAVGSIAVLVVLFVVLASGGEDNSTPTGASGSAEFKVEAADGAPVGGVQELSVDQGTSVVITVKSNSDQEVHLHGYDIMVDLTAGKSERIEFTADIDGVFELELEDTAAQLASLRVNP